MSNITKLKQLILLFGDFLVFYLTLAFTLFLRYQALPTSDLWQSHWQLFTPIFVGWAVVFYIADLYNIHALKNNFEFNKRWGIVLGVNTLLAIAVFYFLPNETGLTPKTNLLFFALNFGILGFVWRRLYNIFLRKGEAQNKVLLIGNGLVAEKIFNQIKQNPQLGYEIKFWMKEGLEDKSFDYLAQIILKEKIDLIAVPAHVKKNSQVARKIYQNLVLGIEVIDLASLYSLIFQKVPLSELEEVWFLENITRKNRIYESIKRPLEFILAIFIFLILLAPAIVISLVIKLTSRGQIFIKQIRVGQNEKKFTLYKFRSMYQDAEKTGPQWSNENDPRVTPFGNFLRFTHLDEVPQLINILKGEISFVGPRPERPEFVAQLKKDIPYYDLRHLVKPGLTGWAQLNYRYGSSVEDAYEKLQHDIYYLKNFSFWLDVSILIKTVRLFFTRHK